MVSSANPFRVVLVDLPPDADGRIRAALASAPRACYEISTHHNAGDLAGMEPPPHVVARYLTSESPLGGLLPDAGAQTSLLLIADPAADAEARRWVMAGTANDYLTTDQLSDRLVEVTVRACAEAAHARQRVGAELPRLAAQLERQSRLQEAILASTPDRFFVFDQRAVCTYASPGATALLRYADSAQLVGRTWHDIQLVAPYGENLDADFAACQERREPVRRVVDYEGRTQRRWFEVIFTPFDAPGEPVSSSDVVVTLREITDFKRAEVSLRQAILESYQFAVALENLHIGAVLTDPTQPSNPVIYVNPAFTAITGYSSEEVIGHGLDFLEGEYTDPEVRDALHRAIVAEQPFQGDILNYRKDGTPFWNELQITPVHDADGRLVRFVELQNDVTARRNADARFQRQIRFERLIAGISAKFIRLSPGEVDAAIAQALADIGNHLSATHCVIARFVGDGVRVTHEWHAPHVASLAAAVARMSESTLAWFTAPLHALQPLFVPDILTSAREIPQLADPAVAGLRAFLALPLVVGSRAIGFVGLGTVWNPPLWSPEDVTLFRLAAEIFASGLDREERQQALEESEQRFRVVLANAPVLLIVFNLEGRITLTGGRTLESPIAGAAVEVGRTLAEVFGETAPYLIENCQRTLAGETFSAMLRAGPNGQTVLDVRYVPVRDVSGQIIGGMLVCVNITERYKAEAAEREQRTLAEALRDTASALNSSLDADEVMRCIVENVGRLVPHEAATIILIEGQIGRVVYSSGRHAYALDAHYTQLRFPLTTPTLATMIRTGQPLLVPDVRHYVNWVPVPESGWIRSYVGVPIRAYGEIIGFLNLDSSLPDFFVEDHITRLEAIAGQAAIALQNAHLYAVVRRDANELAFLNRATSFLSLSLVGTLSLADMGRRVVEAIAREFPRMDCRVLVINDSFQLVELARAGEYAAETPGTSRLDERTPTAEAIWQGKEIYVPDTGQNNPYRPGDPRTRSELALPMLTATDVIGVLNLQSEEYGAFSERDLRLLEAFAERAAAAIDNVRLYERVVRHTSELEERVRERTATLEAERAQLNAILESMTEAVIYGQMHASTWHPRFANRALWDMVGYTLEEMPLEGFPASIFVPMRHGSSDSAVAEVLQRLSTSSILQHEIVMRRKDGSTFDAHMTLIRIRTLQPDTVELLCVLRDISKEKGLQEQKDRFIANASHELRTPITNLKMRLYLLARQPHLLDEHVAMLEQVSDRMQELVDDLLDVSRFERGVLPLQRENVVIQDLVHDVLDLQRPHAEKRSLRLSCQLPDTPVVASVDAARIVQVITNLVTNAINYTQKGGSVSVELETDETNGEHGVLIRVRDTGIGIPLAFQDQIFEPFFRINMGTARGTGLGLTISREIVKLHGGSIELHSVERQGTTFTVRLPGLPPGAPVLPRSALDDPLPER